MHICDPTVTRIVHPLGTGRYSKAMFGLHTYSYFSFFSIFGLKSLILDKALFGHKMHSFDLSLFQNAL